MSCAVPYTSITMSFAGFVKQINKANQFMNEMIGGVQGTKFSEDFVEMERKIDLYYELTVEVVEKTKKFLHPNSKSLTKMFRAKSVNSQPVGVLGECMVRYGKQLGEDGMYARALVETGETMKLICNIKSHLDDNMKISFLDPMFKFSQINFKEVMHHRKKLKGRRLDYDCKKR
ncbi:unnamed protein product, partial [Meganyctiphanes norvegica]